MYADRELTSGCLAAAPALLIFQPGASKLMSTAFLKAFQHLGSVYLDSSSTKAMKITKI